MITESIGTGRRLGRILGRHPSILLPLDDALISGPHGHLSEVKSLLVPEVLNHVDAILGYRGLLVNADEQLRRTPFIVNVSASTFRASHTKKVTVTSVDRALALGADAVCFHLNVSDTRESSMLKSVGRTIDRASSLGVPVLMIAYPRRGRSDKSDDNYLDLLVDEPERYRDLVVHSVRIAIELGASAVKTVYTGSVESFAQVVQAACGVPVFVAGGPPESETSDEAISKARSAVEAGAAGVAYGRHVFMSPDPAGFLAQLRAEMTGAVGERRRWDQAGPQTRR